jgi:hypothetical protein
LPRFSIPNSGFIAVLLVETGCHDGSDCFEAEGIASHIVSLQFSAFACSSATAHGPHIIAWSYMLRDGILLAERRLHCMATVANEIGVNKMWEMNDTKVILGPSECVVIVAR